MACMLRSKSGSAIYAQRKVMVEPVNGQIQEVRGLRRFLLRGLGMVDGEWHLIATMHNLLKLFWYRRSKQQALVRTTASLGAARGPTDPGGGQLGSTSPAASERERPRRLSGLPLSVLQRATNSWVAETV